MKRRLWIAGAMALAGLSACSPAKVVHDKDYFAGHDAERTATITACQKNPGGEAGDPNCVNAISVQADVDRKKAWNIKAPASRVSDPGKL